MGGFRRALSLYCWLRLLSLRVRETVLTYTYTFQFNLTYLRSSRTYHLHSPQELAQVQDPNPSIVDDDSRLLFQSRWCILYWVSLRLMSDPVDFAAMLIMVVTL